ncbi:uncharacterized protein LACBIDRAFT_324278, partial [Laccaria bicolor S238N-H82]
KGRDRDTIQRAEFTVRGNLPEEFFRRQMALFNRSIRCTLETHSFPKLVERFVIAGSDHWFSLYLISRCSLCWLVYSSKLTWSKFGSVSITGLTLLELQDFTDNGFFSGSLAPLCRLIPSHLPTYLVDFMVNLSFTPYAESHAIFTLLNTLRHHIFKLVNNLEVPQAKKTHFRALPQVLSDEQSLEEAMLIDNAETLAFKLPESSFTKAVVDSYGDWRVSALYTDALSAGEFCRCMGLRGTSNCLEDVLLENRLFVSS